MLRIVVLGRQIGFWVRDEKPKQSFGGKFKKSAVSCYDKWGTMLQCANLPSVLQCVH